MDKVPARHDRALFERLMEPARAGAIDIRAGSMFGCPAAFVGGRLAFCVYGTSVGVKIPQPRAEALLQSGEAVPFRPYGKPAMREWVQFTPARESIAALAPVLAEAIAYARACQ
jgi:hypothetical protein